MLAYRVFPYLEGVAQGEPGHPLAVARQGSGRWDNPELYTIWYLAHHPEAAIGEAFGNLSTWSPAMLDVPSLPGARRALGVYHFDEEASPCLDLDNARELAKRALRPTHIVIRNRARTQAIAERVHGEHRWAGIQWWSWYRPQWTLCALWDAGSVQFDHAEELIGHAALAEAATELAKTRDGV